MRLIAEILATLVLAALAVFAVFGLELLPVYMMDYLFRSGIVYQGY